MTPFFACGWEDAAIGTHWSPTNGTVALDSTIAGRTGVNAARLDVVSAVLTNLSHSLGAHSAYAVTLRFRMSTVATSNTYSLLRLSGSAFDVQFSLFTDHTIDMIAGGAAGSSLGAISAGVWYTLSFWIDTTTHTGGWSLNGVNQGTPTVSASAGTFSTLVLGASTALSAGTFSLYFDDVLTTLTPADFPFAAGFVDANDVWVNMTSTASFAQAATWDGTATYTAPTTGGGHHALGYMGRLPERRRQEPVADVVTLPEPEPVLITASAAFSQRPATWAAAMTHNDDELVLEMLARA